MTRSTRTARLELRALSEGDVSPRYIAWLNDAEVVRFLETRHERQDEASVRRFVIDVTQRANEHLFGIFDAEHGHVGNIKVGPVHPIHQLADVSLLLGERAVWGRGYATEAIAGVSALAFAELGCAKLSASMYRQNIASRRAFLRAGYVEEGVRRDHYQLGDERADLIELGLLPQDKRAV